MTRKQSRVPAYSSSALILSPLPHAGLGPVVSQTHTLSCRRGVSCQFIVTYIIYLPKGLGLFLSRHFESMLDISATVISDIFNVNRANKAVSRR